MSVASQTSPLARNMPLPKHNFSPIKPCFPEFTSICVRRFRRVTTRRWGWKGRKDLYTKLLTWGACCPSAPSSWSWWSWKSWWEWEFFFLFDERRPFLVPKITVGETSPNDTHCKIENPHLRCSYLLKICLTWQMWTKSLYNHIKSTDTIGRCRWNRIFNICVYMICWRYWTSSYCSSCASRLLEDNIFRWSYSCNIVRFLISSFDLWRSQWEWKIKLSWSLRVELLVLL